jgi:protein-tyrosine phosphatase
MLRCMIIGFPLRLHLFFLLLCAFVYSRFNGFSFVSGRGASNVGMQKLLPICGFSLTLLPMMTKVLFVSMGNICRSPSAEGVFRRLIDDAGLSGVVGVDSAGTHNFHVGEAPDARVQAAARKRGYDISQCQARQITQDDFREYDMILAMDWEDRSALMQQCPKIYQHKLMLLMRFANEFEEATVPDPYYGGPDGFSKVLDYLEDACQGVMELVRKRVTQYQAA